MPLDHLAIIDPAVRVPEIDCYNQLAKRISMKTSYHLPALFGMDTLMALENTITAFIVLGSSSSVNDRAPWQCQLENWLKLQLEFKKPTLGLCYGHQMLAYLFGGRVDFLYTDKHKLQGFRKIQFHPNILWDNQTLEGKIYASHRETVVESPECMQIIASSSVVSIEGLAHKSLPVWSFQSHPEATPIFLKNMGDHVFCDPQAFDFGKEIIDYFLNHVEKI